MNQLALDLQPVQEVYRIPLTKGQFALVDGEDFEILSKLKWSAYWSEYTQSFYACHRTTINGGRIRVWMAQRIIPPPDGCVVDHRNHDTLDNRRSNLRIATRSENSRNCRLRKIPASGLKGAHLMKRSGKYQAQIHINGRYMHIGMFDTAEDAHAAYVKVAKERDGEFFCAG